MRVLLAIDGSTHSDAAVAEVAARPWPEGTDIRVLTVVHATAPLVLDPAFVMAAIHVEQTKEQLQQAPDIVAAAKELIVRNADLIVVGSHGYGRVKRLVLGSVAAAVVASAPCSVQVVRAKHAVEAAEPAA